VREEYSRLIEDRLKELIHTDDPDEVLQNINLVIQQTAETTLGTVRKTKKPWITEATLKLADKKRDAKGKQMQSENHKQVYNALCRDTKISARADKQRWIEEQCKTIQNSFDAGKVREAYKTIKQVKRKYQPRTSSIKDKNGKLLTEKEDVLARWGEYCSELYSDDQKQDTQILIELDQISPEADEEVDKPILMVEVEAAIRKLKNNKSPGIDGIPAELIKNGGQALLQALHRLCCIVWAKEQIPLQWG